MRNYLGPILCTLIVLGWAGILIRASILADYDFEQRVQSFWELSDKASTIEAKSDKLDKFVSALAETKLQGTYNATKLKTPNNSFDQNFAALLTLQARLHEIKRMDVASLSYQQAISQVTAQEQGQADEMLGTFYGCWMLREHPWLWGWHVGVSILLLVVFVIATFVYWLVVEPYY